MAAVGVLTVPCSWQASPPHLNPAVPGRPGARREWELPSGLTAGETEQLSGLVAYVLSMTYGLDGVNPFGHVFIISSALNTKREDRTTLLTA